jgi:methionyl aminopeptidase
MRVRDRIEYKTLEQVLLMRQAGLVVADALDAVRAALQPGVTTAQLDALAETVIRDAGATPNFLGYQGYPATLCISVNDEVVHGIPGKRVIREGDVVSVDGGAIVSGWHGDSAFTTVLPGADGAVDPRDQALCDVTEAAMWRGIAAMSRAERLVEIGAAIEDWVEAGSTATATGSPADGTTAKSPGAGRYGLVEDYGGHGIGTQMHQEPHVLNYRTRDRGPRLRTGMCLAIEPMVTLGNPEVRTLPDAWTVVTKDGSRAAHWEHSSALLEDGVWVLTARDGGVAALDVIGARVSASARAAVSG